MREKEQNTTHYEGTILSRERERESETTRRKKYNSFMAVKRDKLSSSYIFFVLYRCKKFYYGTYIYMYSIVFFLLHCTTYEYILRQFIQSWRSLIRNIFVPELKSHFSPWPGKKFVSFRQENRRSEKVFLLLLRAVVIPGDNFGLLHFFACTNAAIRSYKTTTL